MTILAQLRQSGRSLPRLLRDALVLWSPLALVILVLAFAASRLAAAGLQLVYRVTTLDEFCTVPARGGAVLPCTGMDGVLIPESVRPIGAQADIERFTYARYRLARQRLLPVSAEAWSKAARSPMAVQDAVSPGAVLGLEPAPEDDPELVRLKQELRSLVRQPAPSTLFEIVQEATLGAGSFAPDPPAGGTGRRSPRTSQPGGLWRSVGPGPRATAPAQPDFLLAGQDAGATGRHDARRIGSARRGRRRDRCRGGRARRRGSRAGAQRRRGPGRDRATRQARRGRGSAVRRGGHTRALHGRQRRRSPAPARGRFRARCRRSRRAHVQFRRLRLYRSAGWRIGVGVAGLPRKRAPLHRSLACTGGSLARRRGSAPWRAEALRPRTGRCGAEHAGAGRTRRNPPGPAEMRLAAATQLPRQCRAFIGGRWLCGSRGGAVG